jgi:hypothetical protein
MLLGWLCLDRRLSDPMVCICQSQTKSCHSVKLPNFYKCFLQVILHILEKGSFQRGRLDESGLSLLRELRASHQKSKSSAERKHSRSSKVTKSTMIFK